MRLEQQVTTLEISKKLKELGVKRESVFYWQEYPGGETRLIQGISEYANEKNVHTSAFTVAELGEMLPRNTSLTRQDSNGAWLYPEQDGDRKLEFTEADARGKMLIYLLENKLITL